MSDLLNWGATDINILAIKNESKGAHYCYNFEDEIDEKIDKALERKAKMMSNRQTRHDNED